MILKGVLDSYPPTISVVVSLRKIGHDVSLFCNEISNELLEYLKKFNIEIYIQNYSRGSNILTKFTEYYLFRRAAIKHIEKTYVVDNSFIWLATADSAIAIGTSVKEYKFVLNILELYDEFPIHRYLISKLAIFASAVVVPEFNRANVFRVWLKLKRLPYVLENYPNYSLLTNEQNDFTQKLELKIEDIKNFANKRKIFIYQGHIRKIDILCQALNKLNSEVCLILMGYENDYVKQLELQYPSLIKYVGFVSPPFHLKFTQIADFAILYYEPDSLNNVFCAPNKIWEYSKFGLPMLGNDLAGLNILRLNNFGRICEFYDITELNECISDLILNQKLLSKNATDYFENYSYESIIKNIVEKISLSQ